MTTTRCPVCRKSFKTIESKSLPFCSERCRLVDLKRWLGEEYSVPTRPHNPEDEEVADEQVGFRAGQDDEE